MSKYCPPIFWKAVLRRPTKHSQLPLVCFSSHQKKGNPLQNMQRPHHIQRTSIHTCSRAKGILNLFFGGQINTFCRPRAMFLAVQLQFRVRFFMFLPKRTGYISCAVSFSAFMASCCLTNAPVFNTWSMGVFDSKSPSVTQALRLHHRLWLLVLCWSDNQRSSGEAESWEPPGLQESTDIRTRRCWVIRWDLDLRDQRQVFQNMAEVVKTDRGLSSICSL